MHCIFKYFIVVYSFLLFVKIITNDGYKTEYDKFIDSLALFAIGILY